MRRWQYRIGRVEMSEFKMTVRKAGTYIIDRSGKEVLARVDRFGRLVPAEKVEAEGTEEKEKKED
jgi:hypothetical protein